MSVTNNLRLWRCCVISAISNRRKWSRYRGRFESLMAMVAAAGVIITTSPKAIGATTNSVADSADLSLEQLINIQVTSVSKKETRLNQSPAAIAVVTQDDIQRLGITSIPDALRLVPGMEVAQIDSHTWAVTARGSEGQFANKLLVMVDGRTVYESAFAGVKWEVQDMSMADVDRIEVIRGPGATLWGANAVNGVVNIITKNAKDTQGLVLSSDTDSQGQYSTAFRFGGVLATNVYFRIYGNYSHHDGLVTTSGADAPDDWSIGNGGMRIDCNPTTENTITLQGDYYGDQSTKTVSEPLLMAPYSTTFNQSSYNCGGSLLGRWTHSFSDESQLSIQSYYSHERFAIDFITPHNDTFDFDLQDRFQLGSRQDIVWGGGYRLIRDGFPASANWNWDPSSTSMQLFTSFLQDEITLVPDQFKVSLGSKFEHNDQTGFEVQPSVRLIWMPTDSQTLWAAVSRAVRTPDRFELGAERALAAFPTGPDSPPAEVDLVGADVKAEKLIAYELGYRVEATRRLDFDVATFYNDYNDLIDFVPGTPVLDPNPVPHMVDPQVASNVPGGHSYGAEIGAQWKVTDQWRLAADYSWLYMGFRVKAMEYDSPRQQASLRSYLNLPHNIEFNSMISYVSRLQNFDVPAYVRLDLGLVWRPLKWVEVGIWGQNLLTSRHEEFHDFTTSVREEVPRSVLGKITLTF